MLKYSVFIMLFALVGCTESSFKEHEDITKYAETAGFFEKLTAAKVKFLKCYPDKEGKIKASYTVVNRDNNFPATIRFDYIHKSYNLYFDEAYLSRPKSELINDIDSCIMAWEQLKDAKQTWR